MEQYFYDSTDNLCRDNLFCLIRRTAFKPLLQISVMGCLLKSEDDMITEQIHEMSL